MLKIAANSNSFNEYVEGGLGRAGCVVIERNLTMNPVPYSNRPVPARSDCPKLAMGNGAKSVDFAVSTWQEKSQYFRGQLLDRQLSRIWKLRVRGGIGLDQV